MSISQSLLGKTTEYPIKYQPDILFPIPRDSSRENYEDVIGIYQGYDWWHIYELSWMSQEGIPQVAIGRLTVPADSSHLIESKSLKLYFNSLNFFSFDSKQHLINVVENDLSLVAGAKVSLELFHVDQFKISTPHGIYLDELKPQHLEYQPNPRLLKFDTEQQSPIETHLYSHLLRSNCPVTGQPDWGTVWIRYQGIKPCYPSILAYIISYRQHNGFHEQCVEQIFADIWNHLQPEKLMVYAAYTRRGGLDINPCRTSDLSWMPSPIRLARQ